MFSLAETELRLLQAEDLQQVLLWRNSERIRKSMFTSHQISWAEHVIWFERLQHRTDQAVLLFLYKGEGLGIINFTKIDKGACCCEWGFYIGPEGALPGSGTAMGLLGLDYAFAALNLVTIYGRCFVTNLASICYHEKLGFIYQRELPASAGSSQNLPAVKLFKLSKDTWMKKRAFLYPQIFADYEKAMVHKP